MKTSLSTVRNKIQAIVRSQNEESISERKLEI
jgi:hypothetical protein